MLTHASLFSGIGGAEIAAAWLGWKNLFHCDINEFGRKVLGYWFPQSKEYNDIKTTDFTEWRGRVDVLTAGFPCQPFSMAGKRRGADDDRYLWPETLRAINEIRPTWFVGENVFGIVSMVLPGEEVDMGRTDDLFEDRDLYRTEQRFVIDRICRDIEDAEYTVQPVVIPAYAVGAPHRRDRVWFVARREGVGHDTEDTDRHGRGDRVSEARAEERGQRVSGAGAPGRVCEDSSYSRCTGLQEERPELPTAGSAGGVLQAAQHPDSGRAEEADGQRPRADERGGLRGDVPGVLRGDVPGERRIPRFEGWEGFPAQPPVYRGDDGLPFGVADLSIPFGRWRREAIKALGNAWVPEVAYEIFRIIQLVEDGHDYD
nr:MAG TPA: Cytosine specific methyltransferase [Caudoviricetes sp.]